MVKSYLNCGEKFRPEFVRHRVEISDEHVNPVLYSADNWNYVWADSIEKSALKEKKKQSKNDNILKSGKNRRFAKPTYKMVKNRLIWG